MTEEERKDAYEYYSKQSFKRLIFEFFRLSLLLVWRVILQGVKLLVKSLLYLIESAQKGCQRLIEWWNDNDTQDKIAEIKATLKRWIRIFGSWCVIAAKATLSGLTIAAVATGHGIVIGTKATGRGIIVGTKATIQGIIHLKPTIIKIGELTLRGCKAFVAWLKRCGRGIKLSHIRRKRAYQQFKRNGGVKGAIVASTTAVSNGIKMFMEEDEEEAAPDAVTEDNILVEELEEYTSEGNKAQKIGKKIFTKAKDIMDVD